MQRGGWYSRRNTLQYVVDRKARAERMFPTKRGQDSSRSERKITVFRLLSHKCSIFPVRFQSSTEDVMKLFSCFHLEAISELPETWEGINNETDFN